MITETILVIVANPTYTLNRPGKGDSNIVSRTEYYASKALTFASLSFAGLTFLIAQMRRDEQGFYNDTLFLFTIGFVLFVLSYKLDVRAATRRILFSTQQRLFNFGILSLVSGLVVFFYNFSRDLFIPVIIVAVIIFGLHLLEYIGDFRDYRRGDSGDVQQKTLEEF